MSTGVPSPSRTPADRPSPSALPDTARAPTDEQTRRRRGHGAGRPRRTLSRARAAAGSSLAGVALAVLTSWPLVLHLPQPDRARPRRPGAHRLADRLGRARDAPRPAAPVRLQRLLPPSAEPRLLGLAARLRAGRVLRLGHRRRARPLQPAVPVRLVAVLRRRLPARARARSAAGSAPPPPAPRSPTRPTA